MNKRLFPVYQSHKTVNALKIAGIEIKKDGTAIIAPERKDYEVFKTNPGFGERFKGDENDLGYYVLYKDGYESWSPTKAFEEGYTFKPTKFPIYEGNRRVAALKIADVLIKKSDGSGMLYFGGKGTEPLGMDQIYMKRKNPCPGDYFLMYENGEEDCMNAKEFEDNYTLIESGDYKSK